MNLCLSLAESDLQSLTAGLNQQAGSCPFIEIRLDALERPEIPRLPADTSTRWIATCRPLREGGKFAGAESERLALLTRASRAGFDFLDLETDTPTPAGLPAGVRIIRSRHLFSSFPSRIEEVLPGRDSPGDILKLAVTPRNTAEAVELLAWMEKNSGSGERVILGMGDWGQITRYLGALLDNAWTYVSLDGREVAPGQFSLSHARQVFANWQGPTSPVYAVLGTPLAHSLSPSLHNHLFALHRQPAVYLPLRVDSIEPFLDWTAESRLDFRGFSVTMPHKLSAARWSRPLEADPGPVNTLSRQGETWQGLNTDREGFLLPLLERFDPSGRRVVVLGAGGVARTVVEALSAKGAQVVVVGRSKPALETLARQFNCRPALWSELPLAGEVLVNATPIGQFPDTEASPYEGYSLDFDVVYDLIYRPPKTRLLQTAEKKGIPTISGIEMFVRQAALQFLNWTGVEPDRDEMTRFLSRRLNSEEVED